MIAQLVPRVGTRPSKRIPADAPPGSQVRSVVVVVVAIFASVVIIIAFVVVTVPVPDAVIVPPRVTATAVAVHDVIVA